MHRGAQLALFTLVACGGTAPSPPASTSAPDASPFVPSAHVLPPPIPSNGGTVLASANVVVVTFAGDTLAGEIEAMADWLPSSHWLAATGAEYGVGAPSVLAKVRLPIAAPSFSSTADFSAWVASSVGALLPAPPSASTVYVVVFPSGASFTDPSIGAMCDSFTGYHDASARAYTFAAIGTCPNHVAGLSDAEQVERVFSHELIEALTDPFGDGYAAHDPDDPWSFVGGGEVADVCNGFVREAGFLAVRSWSNHAAASGLDPCVPSDGSVYFGVSAPIATTQSIARGSSLTVDLTGFSTAPTSDWVVRLAEGPRAFGPLVTFDSSSMNNGGSAQATISVPDTATPGTTAVLLFESLHAGDASYTLEPVVVRAQ